MDKGLMKFLHNSGVYVKSLIVIFYAVGIAGMLWEVSSPLFMRLIPLALLLSLLVLGIYHRGGFSPKTILVFLAVFLLGFLVEMWGVNTGVVFGTYRYGGSLGPKLFNTPVIIGINWLLLVYATASVFEKVKMHPASKVISGAVLMLVYDFFLEQAAPKMDMWHWQASEVPFRNYIAWFILALGFQVLFKVFNVRAINSMSLVVFICQFLFFVVLSIALT